MDQQNSDGNKMNIVLGENTFFAGRNPSGGTVFIVKNNCLWARQISDMNVEPADSQDKRFAGYTSGAPVKDYEEFILEHLGREIKITNDYGNIAEPTQEEWIAAGALEETIPPHAIAGESVTFKMLHRYYSGNGCYNVILLSLSNQGGRIKDFVVVIKQYIGLVTKELALDYFSPNKLEIGEIEKALAGNIAGDEKVLLCTNDVIEPITGITATFKDVSESRTIGVCRMIKDLTQELFGFIDTEAYKCRHIEIVGKLLRELRYCDAQEHCRVYGLAGHGIGYEVLTKQFCPRL